LSKALPAEQIPTDIKEYGYGFWFRFLTLYPTRLWEGKNQPWYFVVRLTTNTPYSDAGFGDRLLAIWQGQGYYHFTTLNAVDRNPNYTKNIDYPADIEGVWTYVYYSYSKPGSKAVGIIQYGQSEPQRIQHDVTHPSVSYLNFILAGKQFSYPGLNGQFTKVNYRLGNGAFIDSVEQFKPYLVNQGTHPGINWDKIVTLNQVTETIESAVGKGSEEYKLVGGGEAAFPPEYSISGWFKWQGIYTADWHLVYRFTINNKPDNSDASKLGDRTLTVFANRAQFYHATTYSYANMVAGGNPNVNQNAPHDGLNQQWHFIYYGYSKILSRGFLFIKFPDR
jgi:hypothetical protein